MAKPASEKTGSGNSLEQNFPYGALVSDFSETGACLFAMQKTLIRIGTFAFERAYCRVAETTMLVERGLRVMNVGVVSDAYAIAANYLCRTGAISDRFATDEQLLAIIIKLFERGEFNRIRLANKAIAQFEALVGA